MSVATLNYRPASSVTRNKAREPDHGRAGFVMSMVVDGLAVP